MKLRAAGIVKLPDELDAGFRRRPAPSSLIA
jgi:hypothetical protein